MEVEKREEIEAKHKLYRDARLVYRAEKRLASKVFGIQLFREEFLNCLLLYTRTLS